MTKAKFMAKLAVAVVAFSACVLAVQAGQAKIAIDPAAVVSRYGTIVDRHDVGVGGLVAWTVEKGGRKVVLFTTSDAEALFTGVVWDAATGRNLSDQFIQTSAKVAPAPVAPVAPAVTQERAEVGVRVAAAFDGKFTGVIPESMKTVDSLAGVKEGNGGIADTLYIIIDPRCSFCRKTYSFTREYVKKGYSIKWIPAVALGDPANGLPLAATILQSKDKDVIGRVLANHEQVKTQPTKATEEALRNNLAFMFAAFAQSGQEAGVPVAFFIDRRTGKARMTTGVSETVVLEDIFGKLR